MSAEAKDPGDEQKSRDEIVLAISRLGNHLLSLVGLIIGLTFLVIFAIVGDFIYLVMNSTIAEPHRDDALDRLQQILIAIWEKLMPIAATSLRVIAPVIILLLAIAMLQFLSRKSAQPLDVSKFLTDLPSLIAVLIVAAICLLPLAGLEVPEVLNNVALVVVGFYFGKNTKVGTA